jgi:hypothetical protein
MLAADRPLHIGAPDAFARLEVSAPLRAERLSAKAELVAVERTVRPSDHVVSAASAHLDLLPPSDAQKAVDESAAGTQIHQMVLTCMLPPPATRMLTTGDCRAPAMQACLPSLQVGIAAEAGAPAPLD